MRACAIPSISPPIICASSPSGLIGRPTSTAQTAFVTRGPVYPFWTLRLTVALVQSISTSHADRALVLPVNCDSLRGPGAIALPPVADLRHLVEHCLQPIVPDERAPELVGPSPSRCDLVDHQLRRRGHVRAVDVAHAAGVERVVVVDLVDQLCDGAEVVGNVLGQREHRLGVAEVPSGWVASVALRISPNPIVKSVATLVCRWSNVSTLPAANVMRTRDVHIGWTRP